MYICLMHLAKEGKYIFTNQLDNCRSEGSVSRWPNFQSQHCRQGRHTSSSRGLLCDKSNENPRGKRGSSASTKSSYVIRKALLFSAKWPQNNHPPTGIYIYTHWRTVLSACNFFQTSNSWLTPACQKMLNIHLAIVIWMLLLHGMYMYMYVYNV